MKILVVSNLFFPDEIGGYEILCRQVSEQLADRGHDVVVLTSQSSVSAHAGHPRGLRIRRDLQLTQNFLDAPLRPSWRSPQWEKHNRVRTTSAIESERPDVVLVWSLRRLTLGPARAVQSCGRPSLYMLNDAWPATYAPRPFSMSTRGFGRYLMDRTLWRRCTTLGLRHCRSVVVSEFLAQELPLTGPFSNSKVIPQGVPVRSFYAPVRALQGGRVRLLFVGQVHPDKGPHIAIEAGSRLQRRREDLPLSLTIVGAGDRHYTQALKRRARELNISIQYRGWLDHAQMPAVYAAHDIFLFTSIWNEPFGLTHLEAMASGMPVIASRVGGTTELLRNDNCALSYTPGSSQALASQIERLCDEPEVYDRVARSGQRLVRKSYILDGYVSRIEGTLYSVMHRSWPSTGNPPPAGTPLPAVPNKAADSPP